MQSKMRAPEKKKGEEEEEEEGEKRGLHHGWDLKARRPFYFVIILDFPHPFCKSFTLHGLNLHHLL